MNEGRLLAACAALTASTALFAARDAQACGGCFHSETAVTQPGPQTSVVTAHRMAVAVSTVQTVLWDQVQYTGSPTDFAWVLPVRAGAYVEVGNDAWFETLDAATTVRVNAPTLTCPSDSGGFICAAPLAGCASSEQGAGVSYRPPDVQPVTVLHEGSVGPYETVTLQSSIPGALNQWLTDHQYAVASDVQPVIDAYEAEGFDFIALRLSPGAGVQQMRPVRVVQPGAAPTLPLRMVAAGTGAHVAITLFVVGEGRWRTKNFPAASLPFGDLTWDFAVESSNYASLREGALAAYAGWAWLTPYAEPGALFATKANPVTGGAVTYAVGSEVATTIADAYVRQGLLDGETADASCANVFPAIASSDATVVDPCSADGSTCTTVGPQQIDARTLACGGLDDLAVALTGMHPRDVWITRLEANLPRSALAADLELEADAGQASQDNWIVAAQAQNPPCPLASSAAIAIPPAGGGRSRRKDVALTMAVLAGVIATMRRMTRRRAAA